MAVRAHAMFTTFDVTTNAVMTSATVNVYNPGTVTPISATIFDRLGNPLSNPLTSDATTGLVDFYLTVAQEVDVVVSKASFTTRTYSNVPVLDDSSLELTALLTTTGDIVYASSANTPVRLPVGAAGTVMYVNGGVPAYNANFTANSAGSISIVGAVLSNVGVNVAPTALSLTTQFGVVSTPVGTSSATSEISGYQAIPQTAATSFTVTTVAGFHAVSPTKGSGSTITSAYGLLVDAMVAGNTNNYGLYVNPPSGGSGENGNLIFGETRVGGSSGASLATNATTGFFFLPNTTNTPTGTPAHLSGDFGGANPLIFDAGNNKLWVYNSGWKGVVLS